MKKTTLRNKARLFSLLEILIALLLMTLLTTLLSSLLWTISHTSLDNSKSEDEQIRYCYLRLSQVFQKLLTKECDKAGGNLFSFHANDPQLLFTFDNEADLDPLFSGPVFGQLTLFPDQVLSLITWSRNPHSTLHREELLLDNVNALSITAFAQDEYSFTHSWEKSKERPLFLHLAITVGEKQHLMAFEVASNPITFPKDL